MLRRLVGSLMCGSLILSAAVHLAFGQQMKSETDCASYSDSFEIFDPERWHPVLLYSETQGNAAVEDGRMFLRSPSSDPCEIQVYSLFTLDGDFDIQADYDLSGNEMRNCRFNAGLVLQTLGDEKSYKGYVAVRPDKRFFYRSRLDRHGDKNVEKSKGRPVMDRGTIRFTRSKGRVSLWALANGDWREIYTFKEGCDEKLRLRLKLQTGDDEGGPACPVAVRFDNFRVNACERITRE